MYFLFFNKKLSVVHSYWLLIFVTIISLTFPLWLAQALSVRNAAMIFAMAGAAPLTPFHGLQGNNSALATTSLLFILNY